MFSGKSCFRKSRLCQSCRGSWMRRSRRGHEVQTAVRKSDTYRLMFLFRANLFSFIFPSEHSLNCLRRPQELVLSGKVDKWTFLECMLRVTSFVQAASSLISCFKSLQPQKLNGFGEPIFSEGVLVKTVRQNRLAKASFSLSFILFRWLRHDIA